MSGPTDLDAWFSDAGLPKPPIPTALESLLEQKGPWFWSTRDLDAAQLYDPELLIAEATTPVDDYLAIAHVGHGLNSYFLTYQLVYGRLALFAQVAWGGALASEAAAAREVRTMFDAVASLLENVDQEHRADLRLFVVDSRAKELDICTWVALDGRPRPELERWPRGLSQAGALHRAVTELERDIP